MVAIISAIATIVAAFLSSPLIENWFANNPTPTATVASTETTIFTASVLPSQTPSPITILINTVTSTVAPLPPLINTATASPSPEPKTNKMDAILVANLLEGKAPLNVNLDARASFVQFTDGSVAECGNSQFCSFTFTIIPVGQPADTIHKLEGSLSYKFSRKGEYIVAVYVCRGDACDEDSVVVSVR